MEGELGASAVKTAGSLILILGVIVCLYFVLKKLRFGPASAAGRSRMRVLGTLSLAPKRSIALVEIRDEWLVVGVGTEAVTLLTRMERPEDLSSEETPAASQHGSFRSLLGSMSGRAPHGEG